MKPFSSKIEIELKYTPAEIIAGGVQDARESFAHLYLELHELRQEAAYYYHRAFVYDGPELQQEGAVAFHPSPPEFGGKDLEQPARRVRMDCLTQVILSGSVDTRYCLGCAFSCGAMRVFRAVECGEYPNRALVSVSS